MQCTAATRWMLSRLTEGVGACHEHPSDGAARVRGMVIYLKTAKGLAFDVPLVLLVRADEVIERRCPLLHA